uniref:Uncharacterized protein n=1 Tax=Panagrolaimus superbus TaxID=310955 RepID=A0A914YDI8_9BILA
MRSDKTRARTPSAAPLPRRPEYGQPPYSSLQNQPMAQPDYMTKTTTIVNNSTLPSGYPPQSSGYPPQSLMQPYSPDVAPDSRIRPLQPEFAYQQGPMTWTTMSPVHEGPYPMSPAPVTGGAYQLSTV